jgi:hypothetical protein
LVGAAAAELLTQVTTAVVAVLVAVLVALVVVLLVVVGVVLAVLAEMLLLEVKVEVLVGVVDTLFLLDVGLLPVGVVVVAAYSPVLAAALPPPEAVLIVQALRYLGVHHMALAVVDGAHLAVKCKSPAPAVERPIPAAPVVML